MKKIFNERKANRNYSIYEAEFPSNEKKRNVHLSALRKNVKLRDFDQKCSEKKPSILK